MKDEYSSQECAVCSAPADGLHYGAISCRSCNAFFRRTVVEKSEYRCKHKNNCVIDPDGRCACRSCRFTKCVDAGMKISAVQPRRDPTGSQKERRKRTANNSSFSGSPMESANNSFLSEDVKDVKSGSALIDAIKTDFGFITPQSALSEWCATGKLMKEIKTELDDDPVPSTSSSEKLTRFNTPNGDDHQEYQYLVFAYGEHQRMMQLSFSTFQQFLEELDTGRDLIAMDPTDVNKLSAVELTGLLYWIEKQQPYRDLPAEDRNMLLKRYSVRKLSLDHFYSASKHPDRCKAGEFVMNNYTFVPSNRTGFELPEDDERQIGTKRTTFAPTFTRFWNNVIEPFYTMKVTDAEVVFLQVLLLWSTANNEHVTEPTRGVMKKRRDWVMCRLFDWYQENNVDDAPLRFGQLMMIFGEIELICDMHCQDFQVAKLFEFCDMSAFWYESLCYDPCNILKNELEPHALDDITAYNAMEVIKRHGKSPSFDAQQTSRMDEEESWDQRTHFDRDEQHTHRESDESTPTLASSSGLAMNNCGGFSNQYSEEEVYSCVRNHASSSNEIKKALEDMPDYPNDHDLMMMQNNSMSLHHVNGYSNSFTHNEMLFNGHGNSMI